MTLDDLWKLIRRYWAILLGCTLLGGALAAVFVATQPKRYTASTTAYIVAGDTRLKTDPTSAASLAYSNSMLAQQKAKSWVPLFTSSATAQRVIDELHLNMTPAQVAGSVKVAPVADAPQLNIAVTSTSPKKARDIADAIVRASQKQVEALEGSQAGARIDPISSAVLPSAPSYPNPRNIIPLGLLGGLALGIAITYFKARSDTRIRSQKDVEKTLDTSVLAVIPRSKGLASKKREAEPKDFQTREALRKLRTNLQFVDPDNPPRVIVVTSSLMGEGKSSVASNLARVLGASGERVLLIDADLRRPMISTILEHHDNVGLSQLIAGSVEVEDVIEKTEYRNLWAITAGQIPPNPSELLGSKRMKSLIDTLRKDYFIILDAPPLLPVTDAAVLLPATDGALLVVEAERTRGEQLLSTRRSIETINGHLLGAVINRAKLPKVKKGKMYGQYGQYGAYGQYATYGEYSQTPAVADKHLELPAEHEVIETEAIKPKSDAPAPRPRRQMQGEETATATTAQPAPTAESVRTAEPVRTSDAVSTTPEVSSQAVRGQGSSAVQETSEEPAPSAETTSGLPLRRRRRNRPMS